MLIKSDGGQFSTSNQHNQDAEYSITAVGCVFDEPGAVYGEQVVDEVDISAAALDGFVEIKHIDIWLELGQDRLS